MGIQNVVPGNPQVSKQPLNNAYAALLQDLNDAYWAANTMDVKDQLYGYIEIVSSAVTQLDATDISSRDVAYAALVANIKDVNNKLGTLQQQINTIISRISTAANIISDIANVLSVTAQLFPA
jgi:hypothetical protein